VGGNLFQRNAHTSLPAGIAIGRHPGKVDGIGLPDEVVQRETHEGSGGSAKERRHGRGQLARGGRRRRVREEVLRREPAPQAAELALALSLRASQSLIARDLPGTPP
jgi:hypothetical protein